MAPKAKSSDAMTVDDMTEEEFDELAADTLDALAKLRSRWSGLVSLTEQARSSHAGKNLGPLVPALEPLFTAMLPNAHDDDKVTATRAKFAESFDVHGDKDSGKDPENFEAALLLRRMHRVAKQQEVAERLTAFARLVGDDALHTSELVLIPGPSRARDRARHRLGQCQVRLVPHRHLRRAVQHDEGRAGPRGRASRRDRDRQGGGEGGEGIRRGGRTQGRLIGWDRSGSSPTPATVIDDLAGGHPMTPWSSIADHGGSHRRRHVVGAR